jgi:hypothetical protein
MEARRRKVPQSQRPPQNQGFTIAGAKKKLRDPDAQAAVEVEVEAVVVERPAPPAPREPGREQMREALLALRADIAAMLDDLGSPPRRPKLPSLPYGLAKFGLLCGCSSRATGSVRSTLDCRRPAAHVELPEATRKWPTV